MEALCPAKEKSLMVWTGLCFSETYLRPLQRQHVSCNIGKGFRVHPQYCFIYQTNKDYVTFTRTEEGISGTAVDICEGFARKKILPFHSVSSVCRAYSLSHLRFAAAEHMRTMLGKLQ